MSGKLTLKTWVLMLCAGIASFGTQAQTSYCQPAEGGMSCSYDIRISSFTTGSGFSNISNQPGNCDHDFTSMVHQEKQTEIVTFSIDAAAYQGFFKIWVDWNQDGDFDEADETVYQSTNPPFTITHSSVSGSFVVPATALAGTTYMRVRYIVDYYIGNAYNACDYQEYSTYQDYSFNVVAAAPYCTPTESGNSCMNHSDIAAFTTSGGFSNISNINTACTQGFVLGQKHADVPGENVSFSMVNGYYDGLQKIWVDWNGDRDFDDAGEQVYFSGDYVSSATGNFTIPMTATAGLTRMRVRYTNWDWNDDGFTPCDFQYYSDYEDYDFEVLELCTGTPAGGTLSVAGGTSFCNTSNASLTLSGYTIDPTVTLQWQSSADGGVNWTNIAGATTAAYAANTETESTLFRAAVTCTGSAITVYSDTASIIVHGPPPSPTVSINTPAAICYLQQAEFQGFATGLVGNTAYQWTRDGQAISGATDATWTTSDISKYSATTIGLIVTNDYDGCIESGESNESVMAYSTPDPNTTYTTASGSTKLCEGDAVTFTSKSAALQGATFRWAMDGVAVAGETGSSYTTSQPGAVTATVISIQGCTRSATRTINPLPAAQITTQGVTDFCPGGSVMLEAVYTEGASYRWKQDGTNRGIAQTQEAKTAGSYTVTVIRNSCSAISSPIAVGGPRATNTAVTAATPTMVCAPNTVTLQAAQDPGYTYQWYRSNTLLSGETGSSINIATSGSYKVAVSNNGCPAKNSASTTATVTAVPVATITRTENGYTYNILRATATGTGINYQWYRNDAAIDNATERHFVATESGSYKVYVSKNDCGVYTATPYNVSLGNGAKLSGAISSEEEITLISVYPNPSEGIFYIGSEQPVNIVVKDMQGRTIISQTNAAQVDLSARAAGMYMLLISDVNGKLLQAQRVVKQ